MKLQDSCVEKHIDTWDTLSQLLFSYICSLWRQKKKSQKPGIHDIFSCLVLSTGFYFKRGRNKSASEHKNKVPASYLIMFEVSSTCESLHKGLAIMRHASADSTYSSRLNSNHLINYTGDLDCSSFGFSYGFVIKFPIRKRTHLGRSCDKNTFMSSGS